MTKERVVSGKSYSFYFAFLLLPIFLVLVPVAPVAAAQCPQLSRSLSQGHSGEDVRSLQQFLAQWGFFTHPTATGYFGPITHESVVSYQTRFGIDPIGVVGPLTRLVTAALCDASVSGSGASAEEPSSAIQQESTWNPAWGARYYSNPAVEHGSEPEPEEADTSAPSFSSISGGTPTTYTTTVTWTTDEASDSRVEFGTTTSYGSTTQSTLLTTSHSVVISNLIAGQDYHFRVSSTDASGNVATSSDQTLTADKFAVGAKVVSIGDSIMQFEHLATSARLENQADGELAWARYRNANFRHEVWYDADNTAANDRMGTYGDTTGLATGDILFSGANLGYAGDTATGILQRTTAALNTTADIIVYSAGTNVGSTDSTVAVTTAAIEDAIEAFRAAGKGVVLGTIRPRSVSDTPSGSEISPASMGRITEINDWIRANYESLGAVLWDPWEDLRDPAYNPGDDLYGTDLSGVTRDDVHLTPLGAWLSSESLSTTLASMVDSGTWFDDDPTVDNLLANGNFTGTNGFATNGMTGTMPAGTFVSNVNGASAPVSGVASLEANADTGGQTIVLEITSDGSGTADTFNVIRFSLTNPNSGFTSTDYVSAYFEVEIGASSVRPSVQGTIGQSSTISNRGLGQVTSSYNTQPFPTENIGSGWIVTEPLLVGARTSLNPRLDIAVRADEAGTFTLKIKRVILRTVEDPATLFPWDPD